MVEWFDRMGPAASPVHVKFIEPRLSRLLRAAGRWADMGRLYRDPLGQLRDHTRMLERLPGLTAQRARGAEGNAGRARVRAPADVKASYTCSPR